MLTGYNILQDNQAVTILENGNHQVELVLGAPDLSVVLYPDDVEVAPRETVSVLLDLRNIGSQDYNDQFQLVFDYEDTRFEFLTATGVPISSTGGLLTWNLNSLPQNQSNPFTVELRVKENVPSGTNTDIRAYITNAAGNFSDLNSANDSDSRTINVAVLNAYTKKKRVTNKSTLIKSTKIQALEGDELEYELSYKASNFAVTLNDGIDQDGDGKDEVLADDISDILAYSTVTEMGGATWS